MSQFSKTGISEQELTDILSIDDDLLISIFQYHEAPERMFPIALWTRFKHEIRDYLNVKEADDLQLITWFHASFLQVSHEMYVAKLIDCQYEMNLLNIYHYFMGTWRNIAKDFKHNEIIAKKKGRNYDKAVRATKDQTILFYDPIKVTK